jgi:hypothetical protein
MSAGSHVGCGDYRASQHLWRSKNITHNQQIVVEVGNKEVAVQPGGRGELAKRENVSVIGRTSEAKREESQDR